MNKGDLGSINSKGLAHWRHCNILCNQPFPLAVRAILDSNGITLPWLPRKAPTMSGRGQQVIASTLLTALLPVAMLLFSMNVSINDCQRWMASSPIMSCPAPRKAAVPNLLLLLRMGAGAAAGVSLGKGTFVSLPQGKAQPLQWGYPSP